MLINNSIVVIISLLIIYFLYRINKKRYLKNHYNKPYMTYPQYVYTIFSNPEASALDVLFASIAIVSFVIIAASLFTAAIIGAMYGDFRI